MTKPVVVTRGKIFADKVRVSGYTVLACLAVFCLGIFTGYVRPANPNHWYVTKDSCAPGRTLNDIEEKAWTEACVTLWKIGKETK